MLFFIDFLAQAIKCRQREQVLNACIFCTLKISYMMLTAIQDTGSCW